MAPADAHACENAGPCIGVGWDGETLPPPLWRAYRLLHDALADLAEPPRSARELGYLRVEVEVSATVREPLFWLQAQPGYPRVYFRDRCRGVCVAGTGECISVRGEGELRADADAWPPVDAWHERMRLVGGGRFDGAGVADADWAAYGGYRFVLPAVELQRHEGRTYLACHLRWDPASEASWERARCNALNALHRSVPTAEPSVSHLPYLEAEEELTSRDEWRRAIARVLAAIDAADASKVVLARRTVCTLSDEADPIAVLARFLDAAESEPDLAAGAAAGGAGGGDDSPPSPTLPRFGSLFCMQLSASSAFVGCSPERLFVAEGAAVRTEAVAGTRRRGESAQRDAELSAELLASSKDLRENESVQRFVRERLGGLCSHILPGPQSAQILKLRHVQHLCAAFEGTLLPEHALFAVDAPRPPGGAGSGDLRRSVRAALTLLTALHPTPAVCGQPCARARELIGLLEPSDRGWYAGPFGYISRTRADFCVAIRSALVASRRRLLLFAGAGIVVGSDADLEYAECTDKMRNFRELFAPALEYGALPSPNALHGAALVEELARHGVRHMVICPGSRSTPVTAAAAAHAGVQTVVLHDERAAGFYALGYARASGRAAVVVVTSGTAVANLLPAVVEASAECVPLLVVSADRPPELRDTGANQTINQVGIFGAFVRRFADVPPPDGSAVGLRALLTTLDTSVACAHGLYGAPAGPVHLNLMLREPLEPTAAAPWDARSCLCGARVQAWLRSRRPFTLHAPGLGVSPSHEWTLSGAGAEAEDDARAAAAAAAAASDAANAAGTLRVPRAAAGIRSRRAPSADAPSSASSAPFSASAASASALALAPLVRGARRGLLVAASLPSATDRDAVSQLAAWLQWPLYADVTSGLRLGGTPGAVVLGALDQALHSPILAHGLAPDVIIQFGTRLVSKRAAALLAETGARAHVLVAPGSARHDPDHVLTLRVSSSAAEAVQLLDGALAADGGARTARSPLLEVWRLCAEVEAEVEAEMVAAADERRQGARVAARAVCATGGSEACAGGGAGSAGSGSGGSVGGCGNGLGVVSNGNAADRGSGGAKGSGGGEGGGEEQGEDALPLSEPLLARRLLQLLPSGDGFFVGNSMPIRDADMFGPSQPTETDRLPPTAAGGRATAAGAAGERLAGDARLRSAGSGGAGASASGGALAEAGQGSAAAHGAAAAAAAQPASVPAQAQFVCANRGASGIDGLIATAAGYARGAGARTTLLLGDVSALHDASSLHALRTTPAALVVVIVNNGGGGIFSMLPIAAGSPELLTPFFDTEHHAHFGSLCAAHAVPHRRATTVGELRAAYGWALSMASGTRRAVVLEVCTPREEVRPLHQRLAAAARRAVERCAVRGLPLSWRAGRALLAADSATPALGGEAPGGGAAVGEPAADQGRTPAACPDADPAAHWPLALVCLHGMFGCAADWEETLRLLAAEGDAERVADSTRTPAAMAAPPGASAGPDTAEPAARESNASLGAQLVSRTLQIELPGHGRTGSWRWVPQPQPQPQLQPQPQPQHAGAGPAGAELTRAAGARLGADVSKVTAEERGGSAHAAAAGHGAAANEGEGLLPSMALASAAVCALIRRLCARHRVILVGYSLGGRVALAVARQMLEAEAAAAAAAAAVVAGAGAAESAAAGGSMEAASKASHDDKDRKDKSKSSNGGELTQPAPRLEALLLVSANPGLDGASERASRAASDDLLAMRLCSAADPAGWQAVLASWYSAPLWGSALHSALRTPTGACEQLGAEAASAEEGDGAARGVAGDAAVAAAQPAGDSPASGDPARAAAHSAAPGGPLHARRCGAMLERRLRGSPARAASALTQLSPGRAPSFWSWLRAGGLARAGQRLHLSFLHGEEDGAYTAVGRKLEREASAQVRCVSGCGHALLAEAPEAVARAILDLASGLTPTAAQPQPSAQLRTLSTAALPAAGTSVAVTSATVLRRSLALKAPLALARGTVRERDAVLLVLTAAAGGAPAEHCGVGEATPLPGFHAESADEAASALEAAGRELLRGGPPLAWLPAGASAQAAHDWPLPAGSAVAASLPPSARFALQMAAVQLLCAREGGERGRARALPLLCALRAAVERGSAEPSAAATSATRPGAAAAEPEGARCSEGARRALSSHTSLNALILQAGAQKASTPPAAAGEPLSSAVGASAGERAASTSAAAGGASAAGAEAGALGDHVRALWAQGFREFKIKVGRGAPAAEAARVNEAARALRGARRCLRLDGNRQWTLAQAIEFAGELECVEAVDYAEELLASPADLPALHARTGLRFALDETLADAFGGGGSEALRAVRAAEPAAAASELPPNTAAALELLARADASCGLAAYVVKPTLLGGLGACAAVRARARTSGARLVLSSAFESGLALAQLALLAEALAPDGVGAEGRGHESHGLNTFDALAADLLSPPFAALVDGAHVQLEACEQALSDFAAAAGARASATAC